MLPTCVEHMTEIVNELSLASCSSCGRDLVDNSIAVVD